MKLWNKDSALQVAQFPAAALDETDASAIAQLLGSTGWKALEAELTRRLRYAGRQLVESSGEEMARAQGYYKGFEAALLTAYDIVNAQREEPEQEVDIEAKFFAHQQALSDQQLESY
jgi:hypothetical protein